MRSFLRRINDCGGERKESPLHSGLGRLVAGEWNRLPVSHSRPMNISLTCKGCKAD